MKVRVKARILSRAKRGPEYEEQLEGETDTRKIGCSFVTVHCNHDDGLIYCGLTTLNGDIFWTYDPATQQFASLGYQQIAEEYEVKIHRSLVQDGNVFYGATAGLHDNTKRMIAPGGKLFKYDLTTKQYEVLAVPTPHDYIQTIGMDRKRRVIYGHCHPVPHLWSYDLSTGETKNLGLANVPEGMFCDNDGNAWGTVGKDYRLFKYNPDDGFTIFDFGMPQVLGRPASMGNLMHAPDDGLIYIGTNAGVIFTLDPKSMKFEYLGKPLAASRCHGFVIGADGLIYGAGGGKGEAENSLFAYDRQSRRFYDLGLIYDPDEDIANRVAHCVTMTPDGTIFTGETDHPKRAGCLWECKIDK